MKNCNMIDKGIHVVRGRIIRHNIGSKVVEDVAKIIQQIIRRMDTFKLAQWR